MKIRQSDLNESIRGIPLPDNLRDRPVSRKGYPVPFFAARVEGDWDFRVVYPGRVIRCIKEHLCWICGKTMGRKKTFVAGPMCVVTRTSSEPPSHYSCAQYAAIACPFLANPRMRRNTVDMPDERLPPPGVMLERNPGVTAVVIVDSFRPFDDGSGGLLIEMGTPIEVEWYAQRRRATRAEVMASVDSGLPALIEQCNNEKTQEDRDAAHIELSRLVSGVITRWLPPTQVAQ